MSLTDYRFRSVWLVDAPPGSAYAALYELVDYPRWWAEIRSARKIDEDHVEMRTRSFLPYELNFLLTRQRADPLAGVLEASMSGHLEGTSRWTIAAHGRGSRIVFEESVRTNRWALNKLVFLGARPAFAANHALMMRHGRDGLRTFLAGYGLAARGRIAGEGQAM